MRILFVGGAPRSGTTLIQNILDSHPDIYGAPEFHHVPDVVALRNRLRRSADRGWLREFASAKEIDGRIASLLEEFLVPPARSQGAELVSEKTPGNVLVFNELLELFPNAKFMFLVRDPRAVVASLLRVGRRGTARGFRMPPYSRWVPDAVAHVRRCLQAGWEAMDRAPRRVMAVQYEALVSQTERETRRICAFLGLDWSNRMLTPAAFPHPGEAAIVNDVWYTRASYYRNPTTEGIDRWRGELSLGARRAIARAFQGGEPWPRGYDLALRGSRLQLAKARVEHAALLLAALARRASASLRRLRSILSQSGS